MLNWLTEWLRVKKNADSFEDAAPRGGGASNRAVEETVRAIIAATPNRRVARRHILEELDAASKGDNVAMAFARQSGVSSSEYRGTMMSTPDDIMDEVEALEAMLRRGLEGKVGSMEELRDASLAIVDRLMRHWKVGRYGD